MVVRSHEGREPVAPARVERIGARGRGEQATHSGGVGAPPGGQYGLPARSWLTEAASVSDGHGKRGPTPKEIAGRRAGGRHAFERGRAHSDCLRHPARRPLPSSDGRQTSQHSGASRAARTMKPAQKKRKGSGNDKRNAAGKNNERQ